MTRAMAIVWASLLGAAGLGDIGRLFPPSDPEWRDANSIDLLHKAYIRVRAAGYNFLQADVTVVAERPVLEPYVRTMEERLAEAAPRRRRCSTPTGWSRSRRTARASPGCAPSCSGFRRSRAASTTRGPIAPTSPTERRTATD